MKGKKNERNKRIRLSVSTSGYAQYFPWKSATSGEGRRIRLITQGVGVGQYCDNPGWKCVFILDPAPQSTSHPHNFQLLLVSLREKEKVAMFLYVSSCVDEPLPSASPSDSDRVFTRPSALFPRQYYPRPRYLRHSAPLVTMEALSVPYHPLIMHPLYARWL